MPVLCLSFAIAVLDQLTKQLVLAYLDRNAGIAVIPSLFSLRYVQNTGAAWGILQGRNAWLVALSFVMLAVIVLFRRHIIAESASARIAAGLIIGGIVGNLVDRLRLGFVVDFLDFFVGRHHFPSFNVADSAICVGVGIYMIIQWRDQRRAASAASPASVGTGAASSPGSAGAADR